MEDYAKSLSQSRLIYTTVINRCFVKSNDKTT